jgi:hypothetical protein
VWTNLSLFSIVSSMTSPCPASNQKVPVPTGTELYSAHVISWGLRLWGAHEGHLSSLHRELQMTMSHSRAAHHSPWPVPSPVAP